MIPDWRPFALVNDGEYAESPRSLETRDGIGDRLRAAAFAEIQAREAFRWAAANFADDEEASPELIQAWLTLAREEEKHLQWLLTRMRELGFDVSERRVSDFLWQSFMACKGAREFAKYMAGAEERGRKAGERFHQALVQRDPETARIFRQIALEEVGHIQLALRFFPEPEALKA